MRITISVHGHLCQTSGVGQDELSFTLPDTGGMRIRDMLETLNIFEEEVKEVTLNGKRARMDSILRTRSRIEFFPKGR
ncbi:MAG TPA: hypothetical protein VMY87_00905 [Armatimonadota bacterium]|nr:hypothetical protein [Armatimonadota bacterium]